MKPNTFEILEGRTTAWRSVAVVVGVSLAASIVLGTTLCSLSTLMVYVAATLHASVTDTSRLTAGFFVAMTVATPLVGWGCRFLHPAVWMASGTLLTSVSYALASRAQSTSALLVTLLLCGIGVAAASYVPATLLIARWVHHRKGLAFAGLLSANALGATGFPFLTNHLCAQLGWRGALTVLAYITVALCIPLLIAVKLLGLPPNQADETRPLASRGNAAHNATFIGLTLLQMLAGLSYTGVYFFIVPYLLEAGFQAPFATAVFGSIGLVSVCGFFVNGVLADRWGARGVLGGGLLLCALSTLLLVLVPSSIGHAAIVLFVVAWGATFNISSQLAPILLIEALGTRRFGEVFGLTNFFTGLASALGPIITGVIHDHMQGYAAAFALSAAVMALSAVPLVFRSSTVASASARA